MSKNQNAFAKRQRERLKKEKAQMKRERKLGRKRANSIQSENGECSELTEPADFGEERDSDLKEDKEDLEEDNGES